MENRDPAATDPVLDAVDGEADASLSFIKDGDPSYDVRGVVNVPVVDDRFALRVGAVYKQMGGWMDQPAVSREDINDGDLINVRTKALWQASDTLALRATAMIHRADAGAPGTGEDSAGNYTQAFFDPTTPSGRHDYELYNLTIDKDFGAVNLLSTTTYVHIVREQREIGYRVPFGTEPELLFHAKFDEDTEGTTKTQELRLSGADPGKLTWLVGALYRDAQLRETFEDFAFGPPDAPFFFDIDTQTKSRSWAIFGETSYEIHERIELGVGLRYFEDEQEGYDFVAQRQQSATFDAVSPRYFVRYRAADGVQLYASASKGFRSGGLAGGLGVRPFEPDVLWSYELGAKAALLEGRLNLETALFYSDYEGVQVDSVNLVGNDLTQFTSNAGDARIKGIDWDASWNITADFSVGLGGEVIDTEFVQINAVAASHAVGDSLDFIPDYHVSLWSNYGFDWVGGAPGYLRLDFSQKGKSRYGNRTIFTGYESYSDTIRMLNAALGVDFGNWSASLYARNILDDRGYIDAESIEHIAARAVPRTLGIQVSWKL